MDTFIHLYNYSRPTTTEKREYIYSKFQKTVIETTQPIFMSFT